MTAIDALLLCACLFSLGGWLSSLSRRMDAQFTEILKLADKVSDINNDQFDLSDQLDELKKQQKEESP